MLLAGQVLSHNNCRREQGKGAHGDFASGDGLLI